MSETPDTPTPTPPTPAVERAAQAICQLDDCWGLAGDKPCHYQGDHEVVARAVLEAIGHDALVRERDGLRDKADQWDAAQPVIAAMTEVVRHAKIVTSTMGHQTNAERDGGSKPTVAAIRAMSASLGALAAALSSEDRSPQPWIDAPSDPSVTPGCPIHGTTLRLVIDMGRVQAGVGGPRPTYVCDQCATPKGAE